MKSPMSVFLIKTLHELKDWVQCLFVGTHGHLKGEDRADNLNQVGPGGAFRLGRKVVVKRGSFGLQGHLSI